jgi:periplasmic divalent cation tolerance protein
MAHEAEAGAGPEAVRVVLATAPSADVARSLARAWVEAGVVACVNLVPGVTSVFKWEGRVDEETEVLMIAKTTVAGAADVERSLAEDHPYDVPECVVLAPSHVAPSYLDWLLGACKPG